VIFVCFLGFLALAHGLQCYTGQSIDGVQVMREKKICPDGIKKCKNSTICESHIFLVKYYQMFASEVCLEIHNTADYLLIYVVFQNTIFDVVILDNIFKTGKPGTQWCCVIPCLGVNLSACQIVGVMHLGVIQIIRGILKGWVSLRQCHQIAKVGRGGRAFKKVSRDIILNCFWREKLHSSTFIAFKKDCFRK
jgi:hypothetical protein